MKKEKGTKVQRKRVTADSVESTVAAKREAGKAAPKQKRWSAKAIAKGLVDESELKRILNHAEKLSAPATDLEGRKLIEAMDQEMMNRRLFLHQLADQIDIPGSELSRLRTGRQSIPNLPRDKLQRIADWLGIPLLAAMLLAEQVKPEDFYITEEKGNESLPVRVSRAAKFILQDSEWSGAMPTGLLDDAVPLSWRLFIVWCYERATGHVLISGAANYIGLLDEMESAKKEAKATTSLKRK